LVASPVPALHLDEVDLDMLQLLELLLQAAATATINGDPAQVFEPTCHNLQDKVFYVIICNNTGHETRMTIWLLPSFAKMYNPSIH
jgi:hypothetical protein